MVDSGPEPGGTPVGGSRRPSRPPRPLLRFDSDADPNPDASDSSPPAIRPILDKPSDEACPWLHLHADPDARAAFVTAEHRCEIRPDEVPGPGHQLAYCLTTNHISCPQLRSYESQRRPTAAAAAAPPEAAQAVATNIQPAVSEFRASMMRGAGDPPPVQRAGAAAVSRIAWAAAGVVGTLVFVAGLVLYAAPDNASSDPGSEVFPQSTVSAATPDASIPLAAVPPVVTRTPTPSAAVSDLTEPDATVAPSIDPSDDAETLSDAALPSDVDSTSESPSESANGVDETATPPAEPTSPAEPTPSVEPTLPPELTPPPTYIVRSGDTMGQIAENLGIDVFALAVANDMTTTTVIFVGDVLTLPVAEPAPTN